MLESVAAIDDRYRIVRQIGAGGAGDVYLAEDTTSGAQVAIKVLGRQDAEGLERFKREGATSTALRHPHIVGVLHASHAATGGPYLVMEYVPGTNLKRVIAERGRLPEAQALEIAADLADALDYAHRYGVIHRDVKPQNVIIDEAGQAKLTDFGIALIRGADSLTQTGAVMGSPHYLSPEQAQGLKLDARSDVYSLGVVLYEMLTGALPFEGESAVAIVLRHAREAPPRPSSVNPVVSPGAEAIVLKALAKDPADRYPGAAEMRQDLERARRGDPVLALADEATRIVPVAVPVPPRIVTQVPLARRSVGQVPLPDDDRWRAVLAGGRGLAPWVAALLITAMLVVGATAARQRSQPALVAVPDLLHQSVEEAMALLESMGLQLLAASESYHPTVPAGAILGQTPAVGTTLERGASVAVDVSLGVEKFPVPDVVERSEAEAGSLIARAGFTVGRVERVPSSYHPSGRVIGQDPAAGAEVPRGTDLTLVVSSGPPPPAPVIVVPASRGNAAPPASNVAPARPPAAQPARGDDRGRDRDRGRSRGRDRD